MNFESCSVRPVDPKCGVFITDGHSHRDIKLFLLKSRVEYFSHHKLGALKEGGMGLTEKSRTTVLSYSSDFSIIG